MTARSSSMAHLSVRSASVLRIRLHFLRDLIPPSARSCPCSAVRPGHNRSLTRAFYRAFLDVPDSHSGLHLLPGRVHDRGHPVMPHRCRSRAGRGHEGGPDRSAAHIVRGEHHHHRPPRRRSCSSGEHATPPSILAALSSTRTYLIAVAFLPSLISRTS